MMRYGEAKRARVLREYLLGTLSRRRAARVERALAESAEWRAELERERAALAQLDALSPTPPPAGLAERTIAAARAEGVEKAERRDARRRWAQFAIATSLVLLAGIIVLPMFSRAREAAYRSSSQGNLKQMGMIFKMYAAENDGLYPPRAPYPGVMMFDVPRVYPEYMTTMEVLVNPRRPGWEEDLERLEEMVKREPVDWEAVTRLAAEHYAYPGWLVDSDEELAAVESELQKQTERRELASAAYDDLQAGGETYPRLKEGIERYLITDINNPAGSAAAQSGIPVAFETPGAGEPEGVSVLYMDGHVEFLKEGTQFPATKGVRDILER